MKIKHYLFGFLFFYSCAYATPFFKGDEIPQCLALPHAEDTQQKCKENALKASEQALVKTVEQLQAMIDENYDDPFTSAKYLRSASASHKRYGWPHAINSVRRKPPWWANGRRASRISCSSALSILIKRVRRR